jgi:dolichyl-phosphooligosaccharide-protein glycotransferase
MDISALKKYQPRIIVALILLFMAVALVIRILPAIVTRDMAFYPVYDTDTWYTLRQIEVMVHSFPQYNWFDPLTAYPAGKIIDWGPGLPFIAAIFCIVTGAVTQNTIIAASGFVSPLLAALMVPAMYCIGSRIADRKTGIAAAGLISFTSFLYFTYSSFGMVDHHIAEVFFSTIFILVYLLAVSSATTHPLNWNDRKTLAFFCGLSALAGLLYFTALITSTTVLLVLFIIAVYTLVQNVADFLSGKDPAYLCILNLVVFGLTILLLLLFGLKRDGLSMMNYSAGLVLVHGAVAAGTVVLFALAKVFRGRRTPYLVVLAGLFLGGLFLTQAVPALRQISSQALNLVSGSSAFSIGVQETLPWSFSGAYDAVNVAILLVAGGYLVLGYRLVKKPDRALIFVAVWSVVMLLLTLRFQRFQYYFTIPIALLCALCITEPFRWASGPVLRRMSDFLYRTGHAEGKPVPEKQPVPEKTPRKRKTISSPEKNGSVKETAGTLCLIAVCVLAVAHAGLSLSQDYAYAMHADTRVIPADWLESLGWLKSGTPDPGIGYFDRYDSRNYSSPGDSYGILAVWDAGHWITFFAHRPPVTNPFQDNLIGENGTAAFFLSDNETQADGILEKFHGRYIITDSTMAVDRFTNLVPWKTGSSDISLYIKWFLRPDPNETTHLKKTHLFDDAYYRTMVVRLHTFDGSLTTPVQAEYVQYTIRKPAAGETADAPGFSRVITSQEAIDLTGSNLSGTPIIAEGEELQPITYADIYSDMPDKPVGTIPGLAHYRLVHESPHDASVTPFPESEPFTLTGIKMVKVFEYVRGARIPGEGIIEIPIVTSTGRSFTYRQESTNGVFIVPYSTRENPYDVVAAGPYHIIGTSRTFDVTEDEVRQGLTVKE